MSTEPQETASLSTNWGEMLDHLLGLDKRKATTLDLQFPVNIEGTEELTLERLRTCDIRERSFWRRLIGVYGVFGP